MLRSAIAASSLAARAQRPALQLVWRATCEPSCLERLAAHGLRDSSRLQASRGFACASRFDLPPPKMVLVEYDEKHVDHFISLADAVEDEYADLSVDGNPGGKEPRKGAFEVTMEDGSVLFSQLKAGRLPKPNEVIGAIKKVHMTRQQAETGDRAACVI